METRYRPVRRVLVIDDEQEFLDAAVKWMVGREVHCEIEGVAGAERCRREQFDLIIVDLFIGNERGDRLVEELAAEDGERRFALVSAGFDLVTAFRLSKRMPSNVLLRPKVGANFFADLLQAAEYGEADVEPLTWEIASLDDVKREHVKRVIARSGQNRSEAARRLGIHRSTLGRIAAEAPDAWARGGED